MEAENSHSLQTGNPGTLEWFQPKPKGLSTKSAYVQRQENMDVLTHAESKSPFPPPFCSTRDLSGVDHAHLRW